MNFASLPPGFRIGPYEIGASLGSGGTGVVYRGRDTRLDRDVAIKVLSAHLAADPDRLLRFQREAQLLAQLNHPGICVIHGIEQVDDLLALVLELVEGPTLEERIQAGPIAVAEALPIALQIAEALEAAHEKGIIHRDLKPANVKITPGGKVKILDFGLSKVLGPGKSLDGSPVPGILSSTSTTEPGMVVGTPSYMAPEQARGLAVDRRADIWAFGAVLYEMLSGRRLFTGSTATDVMVAVVASDLDFSRLPQETPVALRELLRRCLRRDLRSRQQDIGDVRLALEEMFPLATPSALPAVAGSVGQRTGRPSRLLAGLVIGLAALAGAALLLRPARSHPPATYSQLTFRRGTIHSARFTPQGEAAVYGAGWEGRPVEVFESRRGSLESRELLTRPANVLAVSRAGEMAVLLLTGRSFARGTLARVSLAGGAPREILESAEWADWAPGGEKLAVVRVLPGRRRLEFPIGTTLYETTGWLSHPRVSPAGDVVAFLDHPTPGDNGGAVVLAGPTGRRTVSEGWKAVWGLAWTPDGKEIWFSASERETARSLWAVNLEGRRRLVAALPIRMTIHDIAPDGSALLTHDLLRRSTFGVAPGDTRERDLSWLDYSNAKDISDDGKTLLFSEDGEAGGPGYLVYTRGTDGSNAVRLGEGKATSLSPDGHWALAIRVGPDGIHRLVAHPTGAGERRALPSGSVVRLDWATFLPDGRRILIAGAERDKPVKLWLQEFGGAAPPTPAGGDGITAVYGSVAVSPDSQLVAASGPDDRIWIYRLDAGGPPVAFPGAEPREVPIRWGADGRSLFVYGSRDLPTWIVKIDRVTGARERWREIRPPDVAGVLNITRIRMTSDGLSYVYTFSRILSDLFLASGLR